MNCYWGKRMIIAATMLTTIAAQAFTIDADQYFAYTYVPPSHFAPAASYILLSHAPCKITMWDTSDQWRLASVESPSAQAYGAPIMPACWRSSTDEDLQKYRVKQNSVLICINQKVEFCLPFKQSDFLETVSLPKRAF